MKKKVQLTVEEFRSIVRQEILKEAKAEKEKEDSLDAQVDRYITSYEADSKMTKQESFDFRQSVRDFLTEGEDEADKADAPKNMKLEDINMANFVNNVMRLVVNYDNLLEVRDTILKRALNFLAENYDVDTVEAYKSELFDQHGVEIGKTQKDIDDEEFAAPKAGAAGPAGGGA